MNSLKKKERLSGRTEIGRLFKEGNAFNCKPFRVVFIESNNEDLGSVAIAISVPKKNFKRAVKRNLIKRRIREAYRLNKSALIQSLNNQNKKISLLIIYTGREIPDYQLVESKIIVTLQRLIQETA